MGYKIAMEIAESEMPMQQKLEWHLTGNHVPPIDKEFIPAAMTAVFMAMNENWDVEIDLPNGLKRSVRFIVEGMHLQPFVTGMEVPNEEE